MELKRGDIVKIRHHEEGKVKSINADSTVWIILKDGVLVNVRQSWLVEKKDDK